MSVPCANGWASRADEAFDEGGMISRYAHLYGTAAGSVNLTGWRESLSDA